MVCSLTHPNVNCSILIQIPFNFSTPASLHQLRLTLKSWGHQLEVQNFVVNTLRQRESRLVLFSIFYLSVHLVRHCASFCKLSHLGRSIPPCDSSVRQFICSLMKMSSTVWKNVQPLNLQFQPPNKFNYHYGMVVLD